MRLRVHLWRPPQGAYLPALETRALEACEACRPWDRCRSAALEIGPHRATWEACSRPPAAASPAALEAVLGGLFWGRAVNAKLCTACAKPAPTGR